MRRARPTVVLLAILLVATPLAAAHGTSDANDPRAASHADRPFVLGPNGTAAHEAALNATLFGTFENRDRNQVHGDLVAAIMETALGDLGPMYLGNVQVLDKLRTGMNDPTLDVDGPVAVMHNATGAVTLHDNRYAWLTARGTHLNVSLHLPQGANATLIEDRIVRYEAGNMDFLVVREDGGNLTVPNNRTVRASGHGYQAITVTRGAGVYYALPRNSTAGPWVLAAHANGTTVADVLRPAGTPHRVVDPANGTLAVDVKGTQESPVLTRLDLVGLLPDVPADEVLVRTGDDPHIPVDRGAVPDTEGVRVANATRYGPRLSLLAQLPQEEEAEGPLTWTHDAEPPTVDVHKVGNLTGPWNPAKRVPFLVLTADEAFAANLTLEGGTGDTPRSKASEVPRLGHRFNLGGLQPDTAYTYEVTLTDLVGHQTTVEGNFTTPPRPPVEVTITAPKADADLTPGPATLHARISGQPQDVSVRLDGRPVDGVNASDGVVEVRKELAPGAYQFLVTATGHDGDTVRDRVTFQVAEPAPNGGETGVSGTEPTSYPVAGPGLLAALVAVALAAGFRRLR